ncbi:hypothetical protein AB0D08_14380 [Kitasatospora sp. NPDC048540]|uniref:hypothetical protein n=1 Tax=unclassified Kitasatospora TaxID=2633591 RepID=UPI00068C1760|nr:hypothetical protein [Kitasatospora sp. MBT63]
MNLLERRRLLLESSGLTVLPDTDQEIRPSPQKVWQGVAGFLVEPDVSVPTARPDWAEQVDTRWRELARRHGLIGPDGTFLIHVGARGLGGLGWARVRRQDDARLAATLTDGPGQPEFVTMSCDGRTACGVTTEEDSIWLVRTDSEPDG